MTNNIQIIKDVLQLNNAVFELLLAVETGDVSSEHLSNMINKAIEDTPKALAALEAMQWQDISSAPRDKMILIPHKRYGVVSVKHWDEDGWISQTNGESTIHYSPSKWMPLPKPPKENDDE